MGIAFWSNNLLKKVGANELILFSDGYVYMENNGDNEHSNLTIKKGNVKCQFGMAAYAKGNLQAVENELTE
jgi:hypothetical protein